MELTRFRPYSFQSLSEVFQLQTRHVGIYLARVRFTRYQYYHRQLRFAFQFGFWQTLCQCTILAIMVGIFLKWLPIFDWFIENYRQVLQIKHYETFVCTEIIGFLASEKFWFESYSQLRGVGHGMVQVGYELGDRLDQELTHEQRTSLLRTFRKISYLSGMCYKFSSYGLIPLVMQLIMLSLLEYMRAQISLLQLLLNVLLSVAVNLYASSIMSLLFIFMPHHFFVLKVFRGKLSKCLHYLHYAQALLNRAFLARFTTDYIRLHRYIQLYNSSLRDQLQMHDSVFKMSGLISFIFYIKQKQKLNLSSYFIISIYICTYSMYLVVESRLAHFPEKNLFCHKQLSGLSAHQQWKARIGRRQGSKAPQMRRALHMFAVTSGEIRHLLRIDWLSHFLGNNRFGFTYGRTSLITRMKILQTFMTNFYMMTLFYKKLAIE